MPPPAADTLRRTPLFDRHERAGARLVPFAGWEMPVQYEGIRAEHVAVRTRAGMFDVSHMGQLESSGPQAEQFLQRILSNDVTKLAERGAQYSVLCREDGGVLDDLFTYRLGPKQPARPAAQGSASSKQPARPAAQGSTSGGRFLTVTNAANHDRDLAWFREHAGGFDVEVRDAHADWAMLAVQGPGARAALGRLAQAPGSAGRAASASAQAPGSAGRAASASAQAPGSAGRAASASADGELPARMRTADLTLAGVDALVCGTGYTGEDGCELLLPPAGAARVWDALEAEGVRPAGLGARDTLRLEVCFHLYGNDLSEDHNPIEAGLSWCCKLDTDFVGSAALRGFEPARTLVPFAFTGPGIPRQGNPLSAPHGEGVVTSGSLSPCLEIGIGMAYVPVEDSAPGTALEVDVRGKARAAEVRTRPLYQRRKESSG